MEKSIVDIDYFKELEEQILNKDKWSQDKFYVFDHEAGTGKSRFTQQCLGEMTKTQEYKVLYVQKFKKDNELVNTVERINKYADEEVAGYYCSDIKREDKKRLQRMQVLCITHQMYYQICKGNNLELVDGRDMLIIDESPQLLKEVYVTREDIATLWSRFNRDGGGAGKELAQTLLDMLLAEEKYNDNIECIDFRLDKYKNLRELLTRIKNSRDIHTEKEKEILEKFEMLLNQGFFISQNKFLSYEAGVEFYKLKNNILLDANGSFDYRYTLSNHFEVKNQPKQFDYRHTELLHYEIKTTKSELGNMRSKFHKKAIREINWQDIKKILFVTDIEGQKNLKEEIVAYCQSCGDNLEDIKKKFDTEISIDHFGNLIGKNTYREYDTIVILKTPNYAYSSYVLEYASLIGNMKDGMMIEPFKGEDVEKVRTSIIAGELYQAIKRINRENQLSSKVYLFSDANDAIKIVREQLTNAQYQVIEMDLIERSYNTNKRPQNKLIKLKNILLRYREHGVKEVSKKIIREELGIEAPNLSKLLKQIQGFANENNITIEKGRTITFV